MQISEEQIIHIAKLANLNLNGDEIKKRANDLEEYLDFANIINSINTDGIDETVGVNQNSNIFRKDEVIKYENKEELLQNAPSQDEGMFRIPKVID